MKRLPSCYVTYWKSQRLLTARHFSKLYVRKNQNICLYCVGLMCLANNKGLRKNLITCLVYQNYMFCSRLNYHLTWIPFKLSLQFIQNNFLSLLLVYRSKLPNQRSTHTQVLFKNVILKNLHIQKKVTMSKFLFKKRLRRKCFSVNFAKLFRTPFYRTPVGNSSYI